MITVSVLRDALIADQCGVTDRFTAVAEVISEVRELEATTSGVVTTDSMVGVAVITDECDVAGFTAVNDVISVVRAIEVAGAVIAIMRSDFADDLRGDENMKRVLVNRQAK